MQDIRERTMGCLFFKSLFRRSDEVVKTALSS
jgi:hypothetical protein